MKPTARTARNLLRHERFGVLSTLSKKLGGYPFGSITGYLLDAEACPIMLISTLAEHTRNIDADPRVSLLAHEAATDWQAHGRVTVIGLAARIQEDAAELETLRRRYLRYFPQAEDYFAAHDFFFYRITPEKIRLIGGFGDIHWVDATDYLLPHMPLAAQEEGILAHMNQDHAHNLRAYCQYFQQRSVETVEMIGIDPDGFDVRADGVILRFDFTNPVTDASGARAALVEMAKAAR